MYWYTNDFRKADHTRDYPPPNPQNPPQTPPEDEHRNARAAQRMQHLQMTDPDDRRQGQSSRNRNIAPLSAIQQPAFSHNIPQVQIPANLDAPRQFPWPVNRPQDQTVPLAADDPFAVTTGQIIGDLLFLLATILGLIYLKCKYH